MDWGELVRIFGVLILFWFGLIFADSKSVSVVEIVDRIVAKSEKSREETVRVVENNE